MVASGCAREALCMLRYSPLLSCEVLLGLKLKRCPHVSRNGHNRSGTLVCGIRYFLIWISNPKIIKFLVERNSQDESLHVYNHTVMLRSGVRFARL